MNTKEIDINTLEIHEIAKKNPKMTKEQFTALILNIKENGQLLPVVLYHSKIVDGRHRYRALKELNIKKIIVSELSSDLPIDEVEEQVFSTETRRHQTPTQIAICAWTAWHKEKQLPDNKINQSQVAERFGTNRRFVGRVETLYKLAGKKCIDHLFNGGTINISYKDRQSNTTSLQAIISYYKNANKKEFTEAPDNSSSNKLTDEEITSIKEDVAYILERNTGDMLKEVINRLYSNLKSKKEDLNNDIINDVKSSRIRKKELPPISITDMTKFFG